MGYINEAEAFRFPMIDSVDELFNMLIKLDLRINIEFDVFILLRYVGAYCPNVIRLDPSKELWELIPIDIKKS